MLDEPLYKKLLRRGEVEPEQSLIKQAKMEEEKREGISMKDKRLHHLQMFERIPELKEQVDELKERVGQEDRELDIKIVLPTDAQSFYEGHGEGCFAIVNEQVKEKYDSIESGGIHLCLLNNDPVFEQWFHLKAFDPILITLRGNQPGVAFTDQEWAIEQKLIKEKKKEMNHSLESYYKELKQRELEAKEKEREALKNFHPRDQKGPDLLPQFESDRGRLRNMNPPLSKRRQEEKSMTN